MSQREEERENLLSGEAGRESGDERTTHDPIYPRIPTHHAAPSAPSPAQIPISHADPPPEYTPPTIPKYQECATATGMGIPVQVQVDGQTVAATLVQEPSGKHMVYIGDPAHGPTQPGHQPTPPNDYLILALFGMICCCLPLGLVALVKSLEVHYRYQRGDYLGAVRASKQAHSWGAAAVAFGVCVAVIFFSLRFYLHPHPYQNYHYHDYQYS